MAKKHGKLRVFAEYAAVRLGYFVLASLPFSISMRLGEALGGLWWRIDRRHRLRVRDQAREHLGLSGEEAERFVRANFRHYGLTLAEFCRLGCFSREDLLARIDANGFGALSREVIAKGKGLVFITAHLGNWEWGNNVPAVIGMAGDAIARPLDNPLLNEFIRKIREKNGFHILDKRGAIRGAMKSLKKGRPVAVLIDQDAGPGGLMSPFLGESASTITVPMELAVRLGAPLLACVSVRREGKPGSFQLRYTPEPVWPREDADPGEEVKRLVDHFNSVLSEMILEAPEQWFWAHRRWKTRNGKTTLRQAER